jgi:hypothetical protein
MSDKPQYSDEDLQARYQVRLKELEAEYDARRAKLAQEGSSEQALIWLEEDFEREKARLIERLKQNLSQNI